ncbi:MAG: DegV family protein [Eubacteriaceae bacterium]|nr:DegV family protein [Eubacteriaceae bacterium]
MNKTILSSDSTLDLNDELIAKHEVNNIYYHIFSDGVDYIDSVTITAADIERNYREKHVLPQTSAPNVADYEEHFSRLLEKGDEVIHVNLSSAISSSYQNAVIASSQFDNVYCVDSRNLSSGGGLLVLKAAEMILRGERAVDIAEYLISARDKVHTSFILSNLEFMVAGGRCSALTAFGANVLKIKPCIEVDTSTGKMGVARKYRGEYTQAAVKYATDELTKYDNIDYDSIFITSTTVEDKTRQAVKEAILANGSFKNIYIANASCTITSHCGAGCLGILFMTK